MGWTSTCGNECRLPGPGCRDAQAGRRERLDGHVVVGGQATRGSNPAARQVCRTMRNQVLAASVNTNWAFSTSACSYEESPFQPSCYLRLSFSRPPG